jgi:hypothetical protein
LTLLGCDGIDFVGWLPFGKNCIKIERGANRLGGVSPIARHHDDPCYSGRAQRLYGARRLAS